MVINSFRALVDGLPADDIKGEWGEGIDFGLV